MIFRLGFLACLSVIANARPVMRDVMRPIPLLTTFGAPNSALYSTAGLPQYDGVAQLIIESMTGLIGCSGALLADGIHVLTAAHCLTDAAGVADVSALTATFYPRGAAPEVIEYARVTPFPGFNGALQEGNDIGLVLLKRPPSARIPRYSLYTGAAEVGSEYQVTGYGAAGQGMIEPINDDARRRGWNTFDSTMAATFGQFPGWTGGDRVLVSDFDNGLAANDALGVFYGIPGLGLGEREASMAPGDSGAPAFIGSRIAGVASFRLRLQYADGLSSDIDDISNASFGEFNAFTRVSSYNSWIQPAPEPGTAALVLAAFALAMLRRRYRRRGMPSSTFAMNGGLATGPRHGRDASSRPMRAAWPTARRRAHRWERRGR